MTLFLAVGPYPKVLWECEKATMGETFSSGRSEYVLKSCKAIITLSFQAWGEFFEGLRTLPLTL